MMEKVLIYLLRLLGYVFFNSKLWLPVWTGSKGQIGSLFYKYFLTINDLYNGAKIVNLPLAVVEIWFFLILNFDFWFEKEVMVKLGSPSCKYFLTINDLYNGAQIVNLPLAVVEIWFFKILNFDFRFGQEVKVKLGHFCINIFWQLTICTMVQQFWIYLLWLLRYDFF